MKTISDVCKKIAVLRSYPKDSALGKVIKALSREYRVDCFIWDRQRNYQPLVENDRVRYQRCGIRAGYYDLSTFLKLFLFEAWLLGKLLFARIDCIHAIDLDTGLVGLCVAKLRGKAFVYQCLDPYYTVLPKGWPTFLASLARRLENFIITHADVFIITDLNRMPQHEGTRPKRVVEIANVPFFDVSRFSGTHHEGFVVGYIGSLAEGRSLTTVIEAVGELKNRGVRLVIGGFGPLAHVIEEAASKYDNVTYTGWVTFEHLFELEGGFDLFIYVTDKDNAAHRWVSPNKLFESMAFGGPIIVGEGTLAAARVAATGNGVAVPYGSRQALKKAILLFQENPGMALKTGAMGKSEFERNWRPEVMEKRLLEAYAGLENSAKNRQAVLDTEKENYTERLVALESGWKRFFDVQRPYRRHLQRLQLGFVLDIGCGLGRNLINIGGRAAGVGVDHNPRSIAVALSRGLIAYTPEEFKRSAYAREARFDAILLSHVAEHMESVADVVNLLLSYLAYLRPGGKVVFITPQERGLRSDPTHVMFMDFAALASIAREADLTVEKQYSFPFPRFIGRLFTYNEFVLICRKPTTE